MPMDQIMTEGGLFLGIEWPVFWQKGADDVAAVNMMLQFFPYDESPYPFLTRLVLFDKCNCDVRECIETFRVMFMVNIDDHTIFCFL
ncbi:hypothetical protein EWH99_13665 [Sporolactobacillus sp. THM7-7]|nr:hypothetical protein EWH99_13665 [Sporolactobacillus sp. THM7-7]